MGRIICLSETPLEASSPRPSEDAAFGWAVARLGVHRSRPWTQKRQRSSFGPATGDPDNRHPLDVPLSCPPRCVRRGGVVLRGVLGRLRPSAHRGPARGAVAARRCDARVRRPHPPRRGQHAVLLVRHLLGSSSLAVDSWGFCLGRHSANLGIVVTHMRGRICVVYSACGAAPGPSGRALCIRCRRSAVTLQRHPCIPSARWPAGASSTLRAGLSSAWCCRFPSRPPIPDPSLGSHGW